MSAEARVTRKYYRDTGNPLCPPFPEPGARRAAPGGRPRVDPAPAAPGRGARTRTPGAQHQLKAVKVNEGGPGAWHRSTQPHKGGFLKSRESSNSRTPAGAFRRGALTSDPASGPRLFPEAPRAQTRQEVARRKPPTWTAPSRPSARRHAAVCAPVRRSELPGEHRADLALTDTASPAAACEVWMCPPARLLTLSQPEPGARRACPVPFGGASESAPARRRAGD